MKPPRPSRFAAFLVASALLIAPAVAASGLVVGRFFDRHVLAHEEEHTAAVVRSQAQQHLSAAHFTGRVTAAQRDRDFATFLEGLPGVFRVKVFDPRGTIIWSNEGRLVGLSFPDNRYLARALAGEVATVLETPSRSEHVYERSRAWVAEAYVPVTFPDRRDLAGVVEVYKDATGVVTGIRATQRVIWAFASATGLFLYLALALIVWRASVNERRAVGRLEAQSRQRTLIQRFAHDLLRSLSGGEPARDGEAPASALALDEHGLAERVVRRASADLDLRFAALYRRGADHEPMLLAAWPPDAARPADQGRALTVDASEAGGVIVRGRAVAFSIHTPKRTPYVFVGEFNRPVSDAEPATAGALEIMLQEVAIAFGNVELFTEIREAHERLAAILAGIADQMVIVDREMRVVWMNGVAARASDPLQGSGAPCFAALGMGAAACEDCPAARAFASGKVERGVRAVRSPGGAVRYLDLVTAPLRDGSGRVHQVLEVARDITDLVEMEERLRESNRALREAQSQLVEKERLAAVGQVVVGLHHAILNPLAGILGALQLLKGDTVAPADRARALGEAEAEIRKVERLIRRLPALRRAEGVPYVGEITMLDLARALGDEDRA